MTSKVLILGCLLFLFVPNAQSQTETPYQKKVFALTVQFLRNLKVNPELISRAKNLASLETIFFSPYVNQKLKTQEGIMFQLEYESQVKEADKLKTLQEINQNSDYNKMEVNIKKTFKKWHEKGEFERSIDYQKRIEIYSTRAYDSICYSEIKKIDLREVFKSLLKYNPDTEKFGIEFYCNDFKWVDSFYVPITKAEDFKKSNTRKNVSIGINTIFEDKCLIGNNFYPKHFLVARTNESHKILEQFYFAAPSIKTMRIQFLASEIGILYPELLNRKFDYYDYGISQLLAAKNISLINSLGWQYLNNKEFTEALKIFEKAILVCDDKDETYPYILGNLAHSYLLTNNFAKAHKIYFENLNLRVGKMSLKEATLDDFETFKKLGIQSNNINKIKTELLTQQ